MSSLNDMQFHKAFRYHKDQLQKCIQRQLIKFIKQLCKFNKKTKILQNIIDHSAQLNTNLYNKIFRTKLLSPNIFQDKSLIFLNNEINKNFLNQNQNYLQACPFLLPINIRYVLFKQIAIHYQYQNWKNIDIVIHRGRQFEDTLQQLANSTLNGRLHVKFYNQLNMQQQGIDGGGLTKQFLTRLFKIAFSKQMKLFVVNNNNQLLPNPIYSNYLDKQTAKKYKLIGQLIGKSLYSRIMLGVKFAGPFLNLLINRKNTYDDLSSIDPMLYKSLSQIMQMESGVENLCLTFSYFDSTSQQLIQLLPNGSNISVTDKNKEQFISLLTNFKTNTAFAKQTNQIRQGLSQMIQPIHLKMFNYSQLNYLLSGSQKIDIRDWRQNTIFQPINQQTKKFMEMFWNVVFNFTQQQKSLLLKFVTSCQRLSLLGFSDLKPRFSVRIYEDNKKNALPSSHTCINNLTIPMYQSQNMQLNLQLDFNLDDYIIKMLFLFFVLILFYRLLQSKTDQQIFYMTLNTKFSLTVQDLIHTLKDPPKNIIKKKTEPTIDRNQDQMEGYHIDYKDAGYSSVEFSQPPCMKVKMLNQWQMDRIYLATRSYQTPKDSFPYKFDAKSRQFTPVNKNCYPQKFKIYLEKMQKIQQDLKIKQSKTENRNPLNFITRGSSRKLDSKPFMPTKSSSNMFGFRQLATSRTKKKSFHIKTSNV